MAYNEISDDDTQAVSTHNIQELAFSVVGIILLVIAIPKLFQISSYIYTSKNTLIGSFMAGTMIYAIVLIVQCILGIGLFLGGKGLATFWHFLQRTRAMDDTK